MKSDKKPSINHKIYVTTETKELNSAKLEQNSQKKFQPVVSEN